MPNQCFCLTKKNRINVDWKISNTDERNYWTSMTVNITEPGWREQEVEVRTLSGMAWDGEGFICRIYTCICFMGNKTVPSKSPLSGVDCKCMLVKPWTQFLILTAVMLWGNLSYPNSNNWKKILSFFPALTTCWLIFPIPLSFCGLWKRTSISGQVASILCPKVPNCTKSENYLLK